MKHERITIIAAALVWSWSMPSVAWSADELGTLLDQLATGPVERPTLFSLERQPDDGRLLPALYSAFARVKSKREKQWIASTLLRLGDRTQEYSDFLIESAEEAIEDRTPPFADYDRNGNVVKGRFSATFEAWCLANGKEPRSVAALLLTTYPEDVLVLARAHDPRANSPCLKSQNIFT